VPTLSCADVSFNWRQFAAAMNIFIYQPQVVAKINKNTNNNGWLTATGFLC